MFTGRPLSAEFEVVKFLLFADFANAVSRASLSDNRGSVTLENRAKKFDERVRANETAVDKC